MKKHTNKRLTSLMLAAAMSFTSAGTSLASNTVTAGTTTAAETAAQTEKTAQTGVEQQANTALPERKILPARFGIPRTFPTKGVHPRVMFSGKDIPAIRANMVSPQGEKAMREFRKFLAIDTDGVLPDELKGNKCNIDYKMFAVIEAYAFDYVMNGNVENGRRAVTAAKNFVQTLKYNPKAGDIVREKTSPIYLSAMVYDWCHPLLTEEDKRVFVDYAERMASTITGMGGWPMTKLYTVNGHNYETHINRDLLAFAIACYDEYPDIYNLVAGYMMNDEMVNSKNWWYRSGTFHQGLGYNQLRFHCDMMAQFLFYRMNGTELYSDDMAKVPYMEMYRQRPDGRSFPEGDNNADSLTDKIPTWKRGDLVHLLYGSSLWDDPYMKSEYERCSDGYKYLNYNSYWPLLTPVNFLIVNDPFVEPKPITELPRTRLFGSPSGQMIARTGFNQGVEQPDVIVMAKIGETYAGNHAHLDSGSFQIYYKGPLAWDNGRYDSFGSDHDSNYAKETIAHNSLLIYDPNEKMVSETTIKVPKNSGGQRRPGKEPLLLADLSDENHHKADLLAMAYGEDPINPEYSYISGDLAPGYSDKVSEVRRSMMFMPTGIAEKPAVFVVMDKITAREASFKKTFLLHSLQPPVVDGNVVELKRDTIGYNGKLTLQTLYPKNPEIVKVGGAGRQNWVTDRNYPPTGGKYYSDYDSDKSSEHGWGRVEISPSIGSKTDYFLNVMYVSDADNLSPVDRAELIETEDMLGARIFENVTLFAKNKERLTKDVTVTIPGEGQVKVAVAGVSAGQWTITNEQGQVQTKSASEEGASFYFSGEAGTYHLHLNR
ncbi:MAG: heparinase II/III family protein [Eubacteriales bacterium]|nr:heparinase II/III family protein [Eubacteriales bacterium]